MTNPFPQTLKHPALVALHRYADWRVGATIAEKKCYKPSGSILLTFDDYGSVEQIEDILQILRQNKIRAAFFLQGDWAHKNPKLVERIRRNGHVLGNHTVTHADLRGLSKAAVAEEIKNGLPGPWLRPPQGRYNSTVRNIAATLGYVICYWSIDSRDWTGASVAEMRHTILTELHPGAVILFHLHGEHTCELLPELITEIRNRGYQFTDHSESWSPTGL